METSVSGLVGSSEVHDSASRVPELTNGTTSHSQWLVRIKAPVAYKHTNPANQDPRGCRRQSAAD